MPDSLVGELLPIVINGFVLIYRLMYPPPIDSSIEDVMQKDIAPTGSRSSCVGCIGGLALCTACLPLNKEWRKPPYPYNADNQLPLSMAYKDSVYLKYADSV